MREKREWVCCGCGRERESGKGGDLKGEVKGEGPELRTSVLRRVLLGRYLRQSLTHRNSQHSLERVRVLACLWSVVTGPVLGRQKCRRAGQVM